MTGFHADFWGKIEGDFEESQIFLGYFTSDKNRFREFILKISFEDSVYISELGFGLYERGVIKSNSHAINSIDGKMNIFQMSIPFIKSTTTTLSTR